MPFSSRKYICDLRYNADDETLTEPAIASVFPSLNIQAVETHFADPLIPVGRVRCTVPNVSLEMHGEIMQIPGVELFD